MIKYKKMKGGLAFDMFLVLMLIICGLAIWYGIFNHQHKKRMIQIEAKQDIFKKSYIKDNQLMIPIINAYNECESKPVRVVEGCIKHIATNDEDRQKLENYLKSLSEIYIDGLK